MDDKGWSWAGLALGPIWYLTNGMIKKGTVMVLVILASCLLALPFVMIYCGAKAKSDYYEKILRARSKVNLHEL